MNLLIAGGTGFIGRALIERLLQGRHELSIIARDASSASAKLPPAARILSWEARTEWEGALGRADAVINLSGASIAGARWTARRKKLLLESRTSSVRAIREAIARLQKTPRALINASAVGYYGNVAGTDVTEEHAPGKGFLPELCLRWEEEISSVAALGVRTVMLRTSVVLGRKGGALEKMALPAKLFAGGWMGSGRQDFPWIHIDDVVGSILFALQNEGLTGPVNLAAPEPVTMKSFCQALARQLHRPCWAPVPPPLLHLALGEMAEMFLDGARVIPGKLLKSGFRFKFPTLQSALADLFP